MTLVGNLPFLILYPVMLGAAQIMVKLGVDRTLSGQPVTAIRDLISVLLSPWVITGVGLTGLSMFLWFFIISRVELGKAYPFTSLSYFFVQVLAIFLFQENPSPIRWAGLVLIAAGVTLASSS